MDSRTHISSKDSGHVSGTVGLKTRFNRPLCRFYLNFFWILGLGVSVLFGIWLFTDWMEIIGGLLGLGGICAWLAFSFNLIRDKHKKGLQLILEGFLRRKRTSVGLGLFSVGLILLAANVGCVVIDANQDSTDRSVMVQHVGAAQGALDRVVYGHSRKRYPVWTWPGHRDFRIDLEGLPVLVQRVRPLGRRVLKVPDDFQRCNVVLVRPSMRLSGTASKEELDYSLVVRYGDQNSPPIAFNGQSVWVGTEKQLEIPASLKDRWRLELMSEIAAAARQPGSDQRRLELMSKGASEWTLARWFNPVLCRMDVPVTLQDDTPLTITIKKKGGEVYKQTSALVQSCDSPEAFPCVIYID